LQPGKNTKISAQGQHRIARTGQDNRTAPVDRMFSKNSQGNYYWFTKA